MTSKKCVLLGVSEESKAYRLFDPVSKKIVVSKDVVIEEGESWNWGRTEEECKLDIFEWGDDEDECDTEEEADQNEEVNNGT